MGGGIFPHLLLTPDFINTRSCLSSWSHLASKPKMDLCLRERAPEARSPCDLSELSPSSFLHFLPSLWACSKFHEMYMAPLKDTSTVRFLNPSPKLFFFLFWIGVNAWVMAISCLFCMPTSAVLVFDKITHKKTWREKRKCITLECSLKKNKKQKTPNKHVLFCRDKNCTAIWEAFKVVLDKDPCSVRPSDYDLFINLSRHSIPRDKVTRPSDTALLHQAANSQGVPVGWWEGGSVFTHDPASPPCCGQKELLFFFFFRRSFLKSRTQCRNH